MFAWCATAVCFKKSVPEETFCMEFSGNTTSLGLYCQGTEGQFGPKCRCSDAFS